MPSVRPSTSRTVQRILDAAARLFGKEGYRGASMDAVARAAGVSKGLLHYHFQSKEHLLIEAQRLTFRQIHKRIEERVKRGESGMTTALDGLDAIWESLRDMRAWAPFMVETMSLASQGGAIRAPLDGFYAEAEGMLADAIREIFPGQLDQLAFPPERLVRLVRIQIHGLIVELAYATTPDDLKRIDAAYQDLRRTFAEVVLRSPTTA
jgi:AcrR family transcriptional regulator